MRIIDPRNVEVKGPGPVQVGDVKRQSLVDETSSKELQMGLIRWAPGARTKWHTHGGDQIIYFTEGTGFVANETERHIMTAGMIAVIAKGEKHQHGATETTACAHLAISTPHETKILE